MNFGKYFTQAEFKCKHCGKCEMNQEFLDKINKLREEYGQSLVVTSGYRCPEHPAERIKVGRSGMHTTGKAADFAVEGTNAQRLLMLALQLGFTGIGVQQKGAGRFIHLDTRETPAIWSY
jgi:uncharacterized protein YcbK (DUF882 family)